MMKEGVRLTVHLKNEIAFWVLAQLCVLLDRALQLYFSGDGAVLT